MSEGMTAGAGSQGVSAGAATNSGNATATPSVASSAGASQSQGGSAWDGRAPSTQNASQNSESMTHGQETNQAQAQSERILGDQDLDALVQMKVNGKIEKIPLREAIKRAQLEAASHEKMQKAAQIAKAAQQMEQLLRLAEENPAEFLRMRGKNFDQVAEEALARKYEQLQMSPEQRRIAELEEYKKQTETREKEFAEKIKAHRESQAVQVEQQKLDVEIGEAFKSSGLPKEPFYAAQIAAELLRASKLNQDLTPQQAAEKVKARWQASNRSILESMDAKAILDFLGPKVQKILTDYELKRVTEQSASQFGQSPSFRPTNVASGKGNTPKTMNEAEYRAWIMGR